jgi:hypothetical protein
MAKAALPEGYLFSPEKKRALMLGIWNMSIPIGMAAGIVLGG